MKKFLLILLVLTSLFSETNMPKIQNIPKTPNVVASCTLGSVLYADGSTKDIIFKSEHIFSDLTVELKDNKIYLDIKGSDIKELNVTDYVEDVSELYNEIIKIYRASFRVKGADVEYSVIIYENGGVIFEISKFFDEEPKKPSEITSYLFRCKRW
jgi:hypothetical protein